MGQAQLLDGLARPAVVLGEGHPDEVDLVLVGVLADALDAGILIHKSGGNNTRWNGHHAYT